MTACLSPDLLVAQPTICPLSLMASERDRFNAMARLKAVRSSREGRQGFLTVSVTVTASVTVTSSVTVTASVTVTSSVIVASRFASEA